VQAALDLATAAKDVLQHLIADFEANSGNSIDKISSSFWDPSHSGDSSENAVANDNTDSGAVSIPQPTEGPLTLEQALAEQGAGGISQSEDTTAVEEAMARDIVHQNMLELAAQLDIGELDFFRVDEELPKGFPLQSEVNPPKPEPAPQQADNGQQQQQQQQYWQQEQQQYWQQQQQQWQQRQQQQQQQQLPTAPSDSHTLATNYHTELVRAARVHTLPAGPGKGANLQSVKPVDTRTDAQVQQLSHVFAAILTGLQGERRAALMSLEPRATFAVVVAAGTPVVKLQPRLYGMIRPNEAAQLQDVLTVQVQEISKDLLAQVGVL
jgi:hypothetical protein